MRGWFAPDTRRTWASAARGRSAKRIACCPRAPVTCRTCERGAANGDFSAGARPAASCCSLCSCKPRCPGTLRRTLPPSTRQASSAPLTHTWPISRTAGTGRPQGRATRVAPCFAAPGTSPLRPCQSRVPPFCRPCGSGPSSGTQRAAGASIPGAAASGTARARHLPWPDPPAPSIVQPGARRARRARRAPFGITKP